MRLRMHSNNSDPVVLHSQNFWRICLILALALLAHASKAAPATEPETMPESSPMQSHALWVNAGFISHHLQNDSRFNDRNGGFGLEWELKPGYSFTAGQFDNSNFATSRYVGAYLMPLQWGPVRLGVAAGGSNGYPTYKGGGWFAAAIPALSIERERWGLNVLYVPPIIPEVASVVSFQIKFKLN